MTEQLHNGFKCLNCGKIHYPKHGRCLDCKSTKFEEIPLPSQGKLITFTVLKAPPTGIDKRSLNLGIIDLGKVHYTGQIDVENPEDLHIGMTLAAQWQQVRIIDGKPVFGFVWVPT